jgi:hypothetical protein
MSDVGEFLTDVREELTNGAGFPSPCSGFVRRKGSLRRE